ncbi:hypothetical protein COOONC_17551, partial [Cooperia oncophora]
FLAIVPQVIPNASQGDHPAAAQEQAANESPCAPITPLPTPVRSGKCQSYSMSFVTVASPVKASKPADPSPMHPPPTGLEPVLQESSVPPPPPDPPVSQLSPIASDSFPSSPALPVAPKAVPEILDNITGLDFFLNKN